MAVEKLTDNFYEKIKPRLYQRVGRELRLAYRVLDLGCGTCELAEFLSETYRQKVTGVDISANGFSKKRKALKKKADGFAAFVKTQLSLVSSKIK